MPKSVPTQSIKLTDRATLDCTMNSLKKHFRMSAEGYKCHTDDVWQIVVTAAARRSTLEATCDDLADAPAANTVRGYLHAALSPQQIPALQTACNAALAEQLPVWLTHHPRAVACDLHDIPYYGKQQPQDPEHPETDPDYWVCRGEARAGTTRFDRCATAYVMHHGARLNLAVRFVHPGDALVTVLEDLLTQVEGLGLTIRRRYLDKGFCSIPVLRALQARATLPVLMAAPMRGKKGGLRALCRGNTSYRTTHTCRNAAYGELTVPVGVVRTFVQGRDKKRHLRWLVYVLLNLPNKALRQIRKDYRRRFGSETGYRLMEQVRARTTSNSAALRFLLLGVALLLVNLWIALHWRFLRRRGSGPRRVAREHFPLERMARFLSRAVEAIYGTVAVVDPVGVKSAVY